MHFFLIPMCLTSFAKFFTHSLRQIKAPEPYSMSSGGPHKPFFEAFQRAGIRIKPSISVVNLCNCHAILERRSDKLGRHV